MNVDGGVNVRNNLEISGCTIENDMDISQVVISDSVDISNSFQLDGNIDIKGITTTPSMVGMISWFFRKNPPPGWLVCDGGEYPKVMYPDLSNCIGNTYNNVDISLSDISFNVPDLSGHFIRGINGIDQVDMNNENITYENSESDKIGDKKEFKTGCPKTEEGENKELIVDSSNNHNHTLKDNSHNHMGTSIDNSNNTFNLTETDYNSHILYDGGGDDGVPNVNNTDDTVLNNTPRESDSTEIPEHNHTMDPSGSHIHTFENDDDETCPNFIYMLPCIKF